MRRRVWLVAGVGVVCAALAWASAMAVAMSPTGIPGTGRSLLVAVVAGCTPAVVAWLALAGRARVVALLALVPLAAWTLVVAADRVAAGQLPW